MLDVVLFIVAAAVVVAFVALFAVSAWRRSESEHDRWSSRRGEDEHTGAGGDRGAARSHWGGWGRPGSG